MSVENPGAAALAGAVNAGTPSGQEIADSITRENAARESGPAELPANPVERAWADAKKFEQDLIRETEGRESDQISAALDSALPEPKSIADYQIEYRPGQVVNQEFDRGVRELMFAAKLPSEIGNDLAAEVWRVNDEIAKAGSMPTDAQRELQGRTVESDLRQAWGDRYGERVNAASNLLKTAAGDKWPQWSKWLEQTGIGNNKRVIAQLALHAERMSVRKR